MTERRRRRFMAAALAGSTLAAPPNVVENLKMAVRVLQLRYPSVAWREPAVRADFTDDQIADLAIMGVDSGMVSVAVMVGPVNGGSETVRFRWKGEEGELEASCLRDASLTVEELDFPEHLEASRSLEARAARSRGVKGLRLNAQRVTSFTCTLIRRPGTSTGGGSVTRHVGVWLPASIKATITAPKGLELRVSPQTAPQLAKGSVEFVQGKFGFALPYTPESLLVVDAIIDKIRETGATEQQASGLLAGLGCYVGEVFVRHVRASWRLTAEMGMTATCRYPVVLALPGPTGYDVMGTVFERFGGESDASIATLFETAAQSLGDPGLKQVGSSA